MALTDVAVRNAKSRDKLYRLFDERGMYLEVSTTGASGGASSTDLEAKRSGSPLVSILT